jgi:hypothetical protein
MIKPKKTTKRYIVHGSLVIGVVTVVEAASPEEARELALQRDAKGLCHQCVDGDGIDEHFVLNDNIWGTQIDIDEDAVAEADD